MPMNPNKRRNRGSLWEFLLTYGYLAAVPVIIVGLLTLVEVLEGAGLTSKRLAVILICALVVVAFLLIEKYEDRIRARLKSAQGDPAGAKGGKGPAPTEPAGLVPGKSGPTGAVRADGRGRRIDRAFDTPDEKPESGAAKAPVPPLPSTPPTGEPDMPLDDAARTLRDRIIAEIARKPSNLYELSSLAWHEAASCFPTSGGRKWDGAWFYLELDTGRLSVKVSTYPNQFGASYDAAFGISPAAFHRIAAQYGFSRELQRFRTEDDWARLFDDALKSAVSDALAEVQWLEGQKQESLRDQYAVRIPSRLAAASPKMNIQRIALELNQPYASSRLTLTQERGTYLLNYALMSISATQNKALHGRPARPRPPGSRKWSTAPSRIPMIPPGSRFPAAIS